MAGSSKGPSTGRRKYQRRTDEERIAELQARIAELKQRAAAKNKQNDPVLREIPKVQERLRKFAELAVDHERMDLSNAALAFVAQLERVRSAELASEEGEDGEEDA